MLPDFPPGHDTGTGPKDGRHAYRGYQNTYHFVDYAPKEGKDMQHV